MISSGLSPARSEAQKHHCHVNYCLPCLLWGGCVPSVLEDAFLPAQKGGTPKCGDVWGFLSPRHIQDPASQRLTWNKPPKSVLVIKKIRDASLLQPFKELCMYLTEVRKYKLHLSSLQLLILCRTVLCKQIFSPIATACTKICCRA